MSKHKASPRRTYLSLFSGCGGFDAGFKKNGYTCLGAYDIDPNVIETHKINHSSPAYTHDLLNKNLPGQKLKNKVDVVISGSPCQGFSTVGKRKVNDPRNKLLVVGGEIAVELNATVFVAENVMGSTSGKHKIYWTKLEKFLKQHGYKVKMLKCEGVKLGLAQIRKRVIMIAWKGGTDIKFELPEYKSLVLKDVLNTVQSCDTNGATFVKADNTTAKIAAHIKPGQKLSNVRGGIRAVHTWEIPEVFGETCAKEKDILLKLMSLRRKIRVRGHGDADPVEISALQNEFDFDIRPFISSLIKKTYLRKANGNKVDLVNTFNGKYRRLAWDKPSPTVDTRFGNPKYFLHPVENRGFTPREAARIQGFPDNFVLLGNKEQQFKMIGNAVPPPMAFEIAKIIKDNILNHG